jgi:hypothetical protein
VFLGPLPSDFLRVNVSAQQMQEAADRQAAMALQQQYSGATGGYQQQPQHPAYMGKLNITVAQVYHNILHFLTFSLVNPGTF